MAESELKNPAANDPAAHEPAATSATPPAATPAAPAGPPPGVVPAAGQEKPTGALPRYGLLAAACAVVGLGLDQFTKYLVVSNMREGDIIEVLPPVLRWHFIRNSGAAFSMGEGYTWVFTLIMIAVSCYVVYLLLFRVRSLPWALGLGCLLGGALGNLTDRLFRYPSFGQGHVVDFIAFPKFAIFNIADSFIVCSMIFICWLMFRGTTVDGRPAEAEPGSGSR